MERHAIVLQVGPNGTNFEAGKFVCRCGAHLKSLTFTQLYESFRGPYRLPRTVERAFRTHLREEAAHKSTPAPESCEAADR